MCYAGPERLPEIVDALLSHGRPADDTAALVYAGTLPTQETVTGTLEEIGRRTTQSQDRRPAVLVVGRVAALREHLRWFDARPLFGKRVLVTRPREQAAELVDQLESAGAEAIEAPMIRILPPEDFGPLDAACLNVATFDAIVFASPRAVDAFIPRLLAGPLDLRALKGVKLCAVGRVTAERLLHHGLKVDVTPSEFRAESLVRAVSEAGDVRGRRFLLPRADIGREIIADELRRLGAEVSEVIAYRTVAAEPEREGEPDIYRMLLERRIDVVTFTSASAVRNFVNVIGADPASDLLRTTLVASIGPVTAEAASRHRIETTIMPAQYTVPALVDAIVKHFEQTTGCQKTQPELSVSQDNGNHKEHEEQFLLMKAGKPMAHVHTHTALTLTKRLRRLRTSPAMRALVQETRLSPEMLMLPLFICEGEGVRREVPSMPGVFNLSVDEAVREVEAAKGDGVRSVLLLFGLPDRKDDIGSAAYDPEAPVQSAIRAIKREVPDVLVATDVCLCEYTDHGHCGIVIDDEIVNDPSVEQLVRAAVSHAVAGADIVAPSDMMDGRVGAIRRALDERGFEHTAIMAYSAKYCSAFYGPFRDAAASAPRVRRPQDAPDGSGQRPRGVARGRTGYRGGRRHRDGQTGGPVSGRPHAREGHVRLPHRGLPRERRIRDAQGGRAQRMDRRAARDARNADRHPPRRRGHHHHVLRSRGRASARLVFSSRSTSSLPSFFVITRRISTALSRAQRILPGGVDSPVRAFKAVGATPLFIARAHGARLVDVDGNTFIDYVMSWGPLIHGHAPRGLVHVLKAGGRRRHELRRAESARGRAR